MIILQIIWLLVPAGTANMAAGISGKLFPRWDYPIDGQRKIRNLRILGDHKTWRGLIAGMLVGELLFLLQVFLLHSYPGLDHVTMFDYAGVTPLLGFIFGFGALFGDMVKSFFKRQLAIAPGRSWIPFDQIDWLVGSFVLTAPFIHIPFLTIISTIGAGFLLHLLVKFIGYLLKLDSKPI